MTMREQWVADWNRRFLEGDTPWEDTEPSPEMIQLFGHYIKPGAEVLEIGCGGGGADSVWLASQGYRYTGLDIAEEAVRRLEARFREEGLAGDFTVQDIMQTVPAEPVDVVYDRGVFHTFLTEEARARFAAQVAACLKPGGVWIDISGSMDHPDDTGDREKFGWPRLSAREITQAVEPDFEIHYLARCRYGTTRKMTTFLGWAGLFQKRN